MNAKQYKAIGGEILDAEDGKQIGVFLPTNCSKRLRDRIVKCAVENLNSAIAAEQCAEEEIIHLIIQKNYWEEKATELADVVGDVMGFDVGEHSSSNCPVQTAINGLRDMERIIDKWKTAEQRAEQAKKDLAATRIEAAEILHNKQAKIEVLKTAERNAVRECEKIVSRLNGSLEDYGYGWGDALEAASDAIKERFPKHFEG